MKSLLLVIGILGLGCVGFAADTPFWQEISFRSVYPASTMAAPNIWQRLPFTAPNTTQVMASLYPERMCVLSLSADGQLYGTARAQPAPSDPLASPFLPWRFVSGLPPLNPQRIFKVDGASAIYVVFANSIVQYTFEDNGVDNCGSVASSKTVIDQFAFGQVVGVSYAAAPLNMLFVGTASNGAYAISLSNGAQLTQLEMANQQVSSLTYADKWGQLFVGTQLAIYTFEFPQGVPTQTAHVWIGGNQDFAPIDMSFDGLTDEGYLWTVDNITVHRRNHLGQWDRFGYRQQAPITQLSSIAVHSGVLFSGSLTSGMSRLLDTSASPYMPPNLHQKDGFQNGYLQLQYSSDQFRAFSSCIALKSVCGVSLLTFDSDGWSWLYFYGPRWLPGNVVYSIFAEPTSDEASVFVITNQGITYLNVQKWTLAQKAKAMMSFQEPRHDRHGLSSACNLNTFGDLTSYKPSCDDNDGLWSSMSGIGFAYLYLATGDPAAKDAAWKIFSGVERQNVLAGNFPHYPARSFFKIGDNAQGCGGNDPAWYNATEPGWMVKGDTSSDELSGHLSFYPVMYDVAETDAERERVQTLIDGIVLGMINNGLQLIDPRTGKATTWGIFDPWNLNENPNHYSERGLNSVEILGWLAGAYSVTGNPIYNSTFWSLVNDHGYDKNTLNAKIDGSTDENHSDNELLFMAYHSVYYAYQRLSSDDPKKAEVFAMVSLIDPSIIRSFGLVRFEYSPLWTGIYAGTSRKQTAPLDLSASLWSLRHYPLDLINWPADNTNRQDAVVQPNQLDRNGRDRIMRDIRPPSERTMTQWNNDPFVFVDGDGRSEVQPGVWLLPYGLMLYNQLI